MGILLGVCLTVKN